MDPKKEPKEEKDEVVDAMGRKQWDKDHFRSLAAEKDELEDDWVDTTKKNTIEVLPPEMRGYLQSRTEELNLEENLNKRKLVTSHTIKAQQGGFWCTVCECLLKDSASWLD